MYLQSENGKFITVTDGGGIDGGSRPDALVASVDTPGANENIVEELNANGTVSLRCPKGTYVTAEGGGGGRVSTNRTAKADWEMFWKAQLHDRLIYVAFDRQHYLVLHVQSGTPCIDATGAVPQAFHRHKSGALQAPNGKFIIATDGGGIDGATRPDALVANAKNPQPTEYIIEERYADGTVALRCPKGTYVTAEGGGGGRISTNRTAKAEWETFRRVRLFDDIWYLCFDQQHGLALHPDSGKPCIDASATLRPMRAVQVGVDPSAIPLEQLAKIRGGMWPKAGPNLADIQVGNRPGTPENIIATDFWPSYTPEQRLRIIAELKRRGYTHVVMGPVVDSDGYHGVWTPNDWRGPRWDEFLDHMQQFWDHGLAPIVFLHPDGWSFEQTRDELTPLLKQPRAQQLIRIIVPAGWEPAGYNWSSFTWLEYFKWGRETLPNALCLWHNAVKADGSPYDAPVGGDERGNDDGHPNGEAWARLAPFLHGLLLQFGPFDGTPTTNPVAKDFAGQFDAGRLGADAHGFRWHFVNGVSGWPTGSAWGPGVPLKLYAGEITAYYGLWKNMPEADREAWGDFAIAHGADGYMDGGTVAVPERAQV